MIRSRPLVVTPFGGRFDRPRASVDIQEEVEKYARESGRHGTVEFAVGPNVWMAKFTLKGDDPRRRAWQEGLLEEEPMEVVLFHEPNPLSGQVIGRALNGSLIRAPDYRPLDIHQMGASGVRTYLERGNTWGRGEHASVEGALRQAQSKNEDHQQQVRQEAKSGMLDRLKDNIRKYTGAPLVSGADFRGTREHR